MLPQVAGDLPMALRPQTHAVRGESSSRSSRRDTVNKLCLDARLTSSHSVSMTPQCSLETG